MGGDSKEEKLGKEDRGGRAESEREDIERWREKEHGKGRAESEHT